MANLRALLRIALLFGWIAAVVPLQAGLVALRHDAARRLLLRFHRGTCRILGLSVVSRGEMMSSRPVLFVSNHSSYLDIAVLGAVIEASFVARHDVASWPLFGFLAKLQRTVFVERRARYAAAQRDAMFERLDAGDNLILFPEGTSSDGNRVLPFKSTLFAVAEQRPGDAPLVIQPVSVAYCGLDGLPMTRQMRPYFAWYGDMELASHLWRKLALGTATVVVAFHAPVSIDGFASRKALAQHCHNVIAAGLSDDLHGVHPG